MADTGKFSGGSADQTIEPGQRPAGDQQPADAESVIAWESDPAQLAGLAQTNLRATPEQLQDAL